jgi:hypothetical protein
MRCVKGRVRILRVLGVLHKRREVVRVFFSEEKILLRNSKLNDRDKKNENQIPVPHWVKFYEGIFNKNDPALNEANFNDS